MGFNEAKTNRGPLYQQMSNIALRVRVLLLHTYWTAYTAKLGDVRRKSLQNVLDILHHLLKVVNL